MVKDLDRGRKSLNKLYGSATPLFVSLELDKKGCDVDMGVVFELFGGVTRRFGYVSLKSWTIEGTTDLKNNISECIGTPYVGLP